MSARHIKIFNFFSHKFPPTTQLQVEDLFFQFSASRVSSLTLHLQAANCCRNSRLVVDEDDVMWVKKQRNCHVLINQFHRNFHSKTIACKKIKYVFRNVEWCLNVSWELKGLRVSLLTLKPSWCPEAAFHVLGTWLNCHDFITVNWFSYIWQFPSFGIQLN